MHLRAPASRTATGSAACSEHARFLLTGRLRFRQSQESHPDSDAVGSAYASITTAGGGAAAVDTLAVTVARVATPATFASFAVQADIAIQTHRAHTTCHAAYAQSAFQADQVDCARLAVIAKNSCSAKFASSANPANPATRKTAATGDGLRGRRLRQRRGFLDIIAQSSTNRPSPSPPTDTPASHLSSPPARPRAQASSTLNHTHFHLRFFRRFRPQNVSALLSLAALEYA